MKDQTTKSASWYQRLFAAAMARGSAEYNEMVHERKRRLLGGLHGTGLEIGPGTGPNLSFYRAGVEWIGFEPNPAMRPYLQREAQRLGMKIELRESATALGALPAADGSMDWVVSTLVLCTVPDQAETLREILRVLKPGGQFVFIEHVAAPRDTRLRRLQGFIRPLWSVFGGGCQVDRETWAAIESAGFREVKLEHFNLDAPVAGPHIAGYAVK